MRNPETSREALLAVIEVRGADECWPYQGNRSRNGYAYYQIVGVKRSVQSWAHEFWIGPVPIGANGQRLNVDHLCHVAGECMLTTTCPHRICCNPRHLEVKTTRANTLRGNGPSAQHAIATHCVNGHEFTPENTYQRVKEGGRGCKICRREAVRRYRQRRLGR